MSDRHGKLGVYCPNEIKAWTHLELLPCQSLFRLHLLSPGRMSTEHLFPEGQTSRKSKHSGLYGTRTEWNAKVCYE